MLASLVPKFMYNTFNCISFFAAIKITFFSKWQFFFLFLTNHATKSVQTLKAIIRFKKEAKDLISSIKKYKKVIS